MAITVYEYGLLQPTVRGDDVVEQIRLAHRYQNKLVELERQRRDEYNALMSELGTAALEATIADLAARLDEARAAVKEGRSGKGVTNLPELRKAASDIGAELKAVRAELKALRATIRDDPRAQDRILALNEAAAQKRRDARAECGVYWGTYLLIEQAADQAAKSVTPPRFQRFTGEGAVGVQIQGGALVEDIVGGDSTRARVAAVPDRAFDASTSRGERKRLSRTTLQLRIGSGEKRSPVWAEWPMIMHRPLPAGGIVRWVKVQRRQMNQWYRWVVQFTVETPDPAPKPEGGTVAIDIGWRATNDGLRVAYWQDDDGKGGALLADPSIGDRLEKASAIRSIRDGNLDELRSWLVPQMRDIELPDDLRARLSHLHQWRSPGRFVALGRVECLPADVKERIEAWRKRDLHLWQYETGLRSGATGHRRDTYRQFAAMLARTYRTIIVEKFDLRQVAKRPTPEKSADRDTEKERLDNRARANRVVAAVSVLRQSIISAALREGCTVIQVPAMGTTQDCHACGLAPTVPWDAAAELVHACEHCGAAWDQDLNACANLIARAGAIAKAPGALEEAVVGGSPRVARFAKRHKAKAVEAGA